MQNALKSFTGRTATLPRLENLESAVAPSNSEAAGLSESDVAFGQRLVDSVRPLFSGPLGGLLAQRGSELKARRSQLTEVEPPMIAKLGVRIELSSSGDVGRSRQFAHIDRDLSLMYLVSTAGDRETWYEPAQILDRAGQSIPSAVLWGRDPQGVELS